MSLGKRSKDPYPADERIIDPKTRLAEERNIDPKICIRQMKESFTSRSFIYPKTQSGGEQLVHLPDRSLTRRHGREVNDSFICRIQIRSRSSFIFHVTCIGSALVARENRNYSFILTGSSDTDLRICIQRIISVSLAEPMQFPMRG